MKLRKSDWIAVIVTIVFFQLMCLWCIDVSISSLAIGNELTQNPSIIVETRMTNGFFMQNPIITYHIGLYVLVICCFILSLISVHFVLHSAKSDNDISP
jgi:hypothetical protein